MEQQYKQLAKDLQEVESKFRSYVDMPEDALARKLEAGIERLVGDAESKKNPRSLETQIKQLISTLDDAADGSDEMMDYRHLRDLKSRLERARDELRTFSNY